MAYRADIEIAVKGAQELKRLQDQVSATSKLVDGLNNYLENIGSGGVVRNINNLKNTVADAANAFNQAALDTAEATIAARNYIIATENLNQGLQEKLALLKQINEARRQEKLTAVGVKETAGSIQLGPGPASPVGSLVGQTSPVAEKVSRTLQARKDEEALQTALLRLEEKSAIAANKELEARSEIARATAQEVSNLILANAERQKLLTGTSRTFELFPGGTFSTPVQRASANERITIENAVADAVERTGRSQRQLEIASIGTTKSVAQRLQISNQQDQIDARSVAIARARNVELAKELGIELDIGEAAGATAKKRTGGIGPTARGVASNALVGGAFPLLFGQGVGASVGGGLGGGLGGALGGTFGFGLSLVGTAIGTAVDEAENLNKEITKLNSNVKGVGTTAESVDKLAASLGIAKDEAVKLLAQFSQFDSAQVRETLAGIFGGGSEQIFQALEQAVKEKDVLNAIVQARTVIGNKKAGDLVTQLKLNGATSAELGLQEALLRLKERQIVADKSRITLQDRLLAGFATIGGTYVDPSVFGKERGAEQQKQFEKDRKARLKILQDAVNESQRFFAQVGALNDIYDARDKNSKAAERAAEREAARVANIVRDRAVEVELLRLQSVYSEQILAAELNKDPILKEQLQTAQRVNEISLKYSKDINDEKAKGNSAAAKEAITKKALAEIDAALFQGTLDITKIEVDRAENYQNLLLDLDQELKLKAATTEEARNQLRIEYEIKKLKQTNTFTPDQLTAIQGRKQAIAAPKSPAELISAQIGTVTDELAKLQDAGNQAIGIAGAIGDAFGTSFKGLIDGSMTAQQALASFFQSVASAFLDMAAQIIAKWIEMTILNTILSFFPGGSAVGKAFEMPNAAFIPSGGYAFPARATGGPVSAGTPYMVGEKGPELFLPNSSGTVVPNNALGGGSTSVVVNVDASGNSNIQGDQAQAKQLGTAISAAVQAELVKQQRPGGLLYSR